MKYYLAYINIAYTAVNKQIFQNDRLQQIKAKSGAKKGKNIFDKTHS